MRKSFLCLAVCLIAPWAFATVYYVDATGGLDSNDGESTGAAWQTINKVNTSSFSQDDQILLKRGETWREMLTVPSSGTSGHPIVFGAYGTGALPKILGSTASTALSTSTWTDTMAGYIDVPISSRYTTSAIVASGQISSTYGGGNYKFLNPSTQAGISGGTVTIYSASDYTAGRLTPLAICTTDTNGDWGPVNVLPGSGNLTVIITKTGVATQVKSITVSN